MASSEGLEARYSAIIGGIASLNELQPSYPNFQVSRITSGIGGVSGRATPTPGTYHRASSGRPSSRACNSASLRQPDLSADSAAFRRVDSQRTAVQPVSRTTARIKTARPESRERRTSAWAAPQYNTSEEQRSQLDTNSWMSGDAMLQPSKATDQNLPGYRPQQRPLSRQVTAPQAATVRTDYDHTRCGSSAHKPRPSSAQKYLSAKASQRPQSRQKAPAGSIQTMHANLLVTPTDVWVSLVPHHAHPVLHCAVDFSRLGHSQAVSLQR